MAAVPLTHHEILQLVEPFTRAGRQVDLAASDRMARRLAFKGLEHTGDAPSDPPLREALTLEDAGRDTWRLTRVLTDAQGLQGSLQAEGPDPADLLARLQPMPPQQQFLAGPGYRVGLHHRVEAAAGMLAQRRVLMRAQMLVAGLTLKLTVSRVTGMAGDIEVIADEGDALQLPEDLLAVLGLDWSRLTRVTAGWRAQLRLRKAEPERSADAQAKLERTAQHLARTLAEPPSLFHERFARARWGVVARRASPLLVAGAIMVGAASVQRLHLADNSVIRMLIFHAPPLLLMIFFCMREIPRIEIPPIPRPLRADAWRPVPVPSPTGP